MKAQPAMDTTFERLLTALSGLRDRTRRKKYIEKHPRLVRTAVVEQLADAVRKDVRIDMERALALAEAAVVIAEELREEKAVALALRAKANALWFKGQYKSAVELLDRAIVLFEKAGNDSEVGRTLSTSIQPLTLLGDYDRALSAAEHARTIFKKTREKSRLARVEINIANVLHRRDQLVEALACYKRAYKQLLPYEDAEGIGVALHNNDAYHSALCNLDQSEIYLELNLIDEAEDLAQTSSEQFKRLGLGYEHLKALTNLGVVMFRKGHPNTALRFFAKARRIAAAEKNPVWPHIIDLYRALVLFQDGQFSKPVRLTTDSLTFFLSSALPAKAAICYLLLARLALQRLDLGSARDNCSNALRQLETVETPMLKYQACLVNGQVHEALKDLPSAYKSYQAARVALETLRGSLQGEELKIAFMKNRQEVYERLVRLCLARGTYRAAAEEAFSYMEEAKCRSLRDLIHGGFPVATQKNAATTGLECRLRDLREELNWYSHRIDSEQLSREAIRPETIQKLRLDALSHEHEMQRLFLELHSLGSDAKLRIPTAITLAQIRAALGGKTILVEYFFVCGRITAAVLTENALEIVPLCPLSKIGRELRLLQFQLSRLPSYTKLDTRIQHAMLATVQAHLHRLYEDLVGPLRHKLDGRHVVFVPHNLLHYLPFHALFDGKHYLIDLFTISYAPSASIYALCHTRPANSTGRSLVLGVPDVKAPQILQEVRSVATALPEAETYLGSEATFEVLKKKGPQSLLVHIATHGYFRHDNPLFSSIRLGDSYLNLYDFYELHLPVRLLALSGCATGVNAVASGDELLGLIRGLFYTGAQSLLLTLWDVHDSTTAKLMDSFYRRLQEAGTNADALRDAMLETREQYPHPYYWAPFILVGKVRATFEV